MMAIKFIDETAEGTTADAIASWSLQRR